MSALPTARLAFGTTAALFASAAAAQEAATALARRGYPRELMSVLTGQPWAAAEGSPPTGFRPDPELRLALRPAGPADVMTNPATDARNPLLAAFSSALASATDRRRNRALWPLVALAASVVAVLMALYGRDWTTVVITSIVVFHVVVIAWVMAYARGHDATFPFPTEAQAVEETLEAGGALLTVRCTLPYRARVQEGLTEAGGQLIGHARDIVYPVPA